MTVVTAVRNSDTFLAEAIDSVLEQSYPNVEYVIVDGASTDGTLDIIQSYGDRIDYWVSERDRSMFDGMNRGLAFASGELLKIHGADDRMPRDSAALAVERWLRAGRPRDAVVRSDMDLVSLEGELLQRATLADAPPYLPPVLHPTWYVPTALYDHVGLYDPRMVVSSDYEMYFYLLERGVEFLHADGPLAQFRSGGTSSTFAGFGDTFAINREYQGLRAAAYVAGLQVVRGSTRFALEQALGSRRTAALRRVVKNIWK